MADRSYLEWPFFAPEHQALAGKAAEWAAAHVPGLIDHGDIDASCRSLVRALGEAGLLAHAVPAAFGGLRDVLDVRSLCLIRETLAYQHGLADFAFAMQGLGSAPVSLYGSEALKKRILPPVGQGAAIAAFALSEAEAGSDVAAIATTARPDGNEHYRIDGEKTWISNGGIAAHYVVFARTGEGEGARGLSAFLVDADAAGLQIAERLDLMAPHPMARLCFDGCRVPAGHLLGKPGEGFKVAMATLDIFRSTVGAAALGLARRALDEALERATTRRMFGSLQSDLQLTQAALADMATEIDAMALLVYRAAWAKDSGAPRITREAAMAKRYAADTAHQVIDRAVQIFGGLGVSKASKVEELYREVRALRIYEGASEVQKLVIARQVLADWAASRNATDAASRNREAVP
jgi:acyl-CoA dehydrogenase